MEKIIIRTENAPAPIGPYNQAVQFGNLLYVSGQVALHPFSGNLIIDNIELETTQVMENLKAILVAAGYGFNDIIKTTIFLTDMKQFNQVNEVYGRYFDNATAPARETVQVAALPKGANVEISATAGK